MIINYFSDLFMSGGNDEGLLDLERVSVVTGDHNSELIAPITTDEVKMTVFSMYPEKSPIADGLNPTFFQTYWNIVADDLTKFCQNFLTTEEIPGELNCTLVCLIVKVKQVKKMTDLRSIALCNVLMRILSKALINRVKSCVKTIVSKY